MTTEKTLFKAIQEHSKLTSEEIIDAGAHGADTGWGGFIYYHETVEFFQNNKVAIIDLLKQMAGEFEEANIISFVASFNYLKSSIEVDNAETLDEIGRAIYGTPNKDDYQVQNALAWFALEQTGHWLENMKTL